MVPNEFNARYMDPSKFTESDMEAVSQIGALLGFGNDNFYKLIDAIGIDEWVSKGADWRRLTIALNQLSAREKYIENRAVYESMKSKLAELSRSLEQYELEQVELLTGSAVMGSNDLDLDLSKTIQVLCDGVWVDSKPINISMKHATGSNFSSEKGVIDVVFDTGIGQVTVNDLFTSNTWRYKDYCCE